MGFSIGFHLGTQRRVQTGPLTKKQAVGALAVLLVVTSVFQGFLYWWPLGPGAWEVEFSPSGRRLSKVEADGRTLAIDRSGAGTWRFTVPPESRDLLVLTGDKQVLVLRAE